MPNTIHEEPGGARASATVVATSAPSATSSVARHDVTMKEYDSRLKCDNDEATKAL